MKRVPTIDGLVGRKIDTTVFAVYHRDSRGFGCHLCVVVILDSNGRLTTRSTLRSVFFHHGNIPVQRLPRIDTYHIVKMGVICVVAVCINNFQYFSKRRVVFIC